MADIELEDLKTEIRLCELRIEQLGNKSDDMNNHNGDLGELDVEYFEENFTRFAYDVEQYNELHPYNQVPKLLWTHKTWKIMDNGKTQTVFAGKKNVAKFMEKVVNIMAKVWDEERKVYEERLYCLHEKQEKLR
jgi:hypothetical protein